MRSIIMIKLFVIIFVTALCNAEDNNYIAQMKQLQALWANYYDSTSNNDQSWLDSGNDGDIDRVDAGVYSKRLVNARPLLTETYNRPQKQLIKVPSDEQPVTIHFRTHGTRLRVQQSHIPSKRTEVERIKSEEEPSRVVHEVLKPVIQEVREIIQPYRKVIQLIEPVIEDVKTFVAKGEPRQQSSYSSNRRYYSSPITLNNNDRYYSSQRNSYNDDLSYVSSDKSSLNGVQYSSDKNGKDLVYSSSDNLYSRENVPVFSSDYNNNSRDWRPID